MLKVGLFGTDGLISLHKEAIENIRGLKLSGTFDTSRFALTNKRNFQVTDPGFNELFEKSDIIDIVGDDIPVFPFVSSAIKEAKHVFIANPFSLNVNEIEALLNLEWEAHVKVQSCHNGRFNPAFQAAFPYLQNPQFIESHRMIPFKSVQPEFSIISDIMIHDIDIILSVVKANIKRVHATGVKVFGDSPDIVNAHLEFDNGATANLTSNRISSRNIHYSKFYQPQSRVHIDFLKLTTKVLKQERDKFKMKDIRIRRENKIEEALKGFQEAILNNSKPIVSLEDNYKALKIAEMITDKIEIVKKAV